MLLQPTETVKMPPPPCEMWYFSVVSQVVITINSPGGVARGRQDLRVVKETAAGQVTWEETSERVSSVRVRLSWLGETRWHPPHLCVRPAPWGSWGWRPWCCTLCTCCPDRRWPPGYRRGRRRRSSPRRTLVGRRPSGREKLEISVQVIRSLHTSGSNRRDFPPDTTETEVKPPPDT